MFVAVELNAPPPIVLRVDGKHIVVYFEPLNALTPISSLFEPVFSTNLISPASPVQPANAAVPMLVTSCLKLELLASLIVFKYVMLKNAYCPIVLQTLLLAKLIVTIFGVFAVVESG